MDFDWVIRGGWVYDGTGTPPERTDVGVRGDRIAAVGDLSDSPAAGVIDAAGMAVTPGFIDVHVHSELARLGGSDQFSGILQGVTTELMGPDGFSWAPLDSRSRAEMRAYLEVFYGPATADWCFASVSEYLERFRGHIPGNLVPQVPHGAVRLAAMGWAPRPATGEELRQMRRYTESWLDAGAVSLCTGLEYQPGAWADTQELVDLSRVVAAAGGVYVAHQRGYGPRFADGAAETLKIGRQAGIGVHISHLKVDEWSEEALLRVDREGDDLTFDMYPYPAGCTHLVYLLPPWAQQGGVEPVLARLRDPGVRAALAPELTQSLEPVLRHCVFAYVQENRQLEGLSVGEAFAGNRANLVDWVCDLLVTERLRVLMIYHWPDEGRQILRDSMAHPRHMVGSDGVFVGGRPHPRGFGTFPRVLGQHVREEKSLTLSQAVHKMTGAPAARFGLKGHGRIAPGKAADIVVFDRETIADQTTWEQPREGATGIRWVMVNGKLAAKDGRPSGALAGRVVGRGR